MELMEKQARSQASAEAFSQCQTALEAALNHTIAEIVAANPDLVTIRDSFRTGGTNPVLSFIEWCKKAIPAIALELRNFQAAHSNPTAALQSENADLKTQLTSVQQQLSSVQASHGNLDQQIQGMTQAIQNTHRKNLDLQTKVFELEHHKAACDAQVASAQSRLQLVTDRATQAEAAQLEEFGKHQETQRRLHAANVERAQMKSENDDLKLRIRALEDDIERRNRRAGQIKRAVGDGQVPTTDAPAAAPAAAAVGEGAAPSPAKRAATQNRGV